MEWIKVEDELPEENVPVLGTQYAYQNPENERYHIILMRIDDEWIDPKDNGILYAPTHWQPLPDFPEE